MTLTVKELQAIITQALDQGILGVEIVDTAPVDANGNPQVHFSGRTDVTHIAVGDGKLFIGAVFGDWPAGQ